MQGFIRVRDDHGPVVSSSRREPFTPVGSASVYSVSDTNAASPLPALAV